MSREMKWLRFLDLGAYLIFAGVACTHWHNDLHHWIGAAISVPSFFSWMLARHQLGDSFAVRAEAKKLVTHGLYSKIRNPIYIFGGFAFLGEFLALGWYIGAAFFVLMNLTQYFRIRREEKVLSEAFGDEYRAYKARHLVLTVWGRRQHSIKDEGRKPGIASGPACASINLFRIY